MDWSRTVFLHIGWTERYDGTEAPEGGHAYLKTAVGVEAENFLDIDGWCEGYAPVGRSGEGRGSSRIPKGTRTLNISKLGAGRLDGAVEGITVVWTERKPAEGPVIVGLYDRATVFRSMPPESPGTRPFIARARAQDCRLVPAVSRNFAVIHKRKGFPGMAAAWFPGEHQNGNARDLLEEVAEYLPIVRRMEPVSG